MPAALPRAIAGGSAPFAPGGSAAVQILRAGERGRLDRTMRPSRNAVLAVVVLALTPACGENILIDPEARAVALPGAVDVAVGASHDLLVVACEDHQSLGEFVFPVAATALFVGVGRLDAAFYLPGALVEAAIPECESVEYSVTDARLEGDAFELIATANDKAYRARTLREGEATFRAEARVGDEVVPVQSTLRAWNADRVELSVRCDLPRFGEETLPGYVPAGRGVFFEHQLYSGTRRLAGYGFYGVSSPGLTFVEQGLSVSVRITEQRGPFTVTSEIDPGFSLDLTAYDATDFDALTLERVTAEAVFAGQLTKVRSAATIGGKVPCVSSDIRTTTITTPEICRFKNPDGPTHLASRTEEVEVEALAPGTCAMETALPGSALTASLSFPVFRTYEVAAALPELVVESPSFSFSAFWGEGADDLHLVGLKTSISSSAESATLRRSGGDWGSPKSTRRPPQLQAVHGVPGTQAVYAVGREASLARWTGTAWTQVDAGTPADLNDVWVNGENDAYVVGSAGTLARITEAGWTAIDAGTAADLRAIWGDGTGSHYIAGHSGTVLLFDGGSFTDLLPAELSDAGFHATGVSGSGPGDVWIHSSRQLLHYDGTTWRFPEIAPDDSSRISEVLPMGDGHVYLLMRHGVGSSLPTASLDRFDGTKAVSIPVPTTARALLGVGNDVYVLTGAAVLRYRHDPEDVFP